LAQAVARPKVCANLEISFPSERQCKPRLRQAAGTLAEMRAQHNLCEFPKKKNVPILKNLR